MSLKILIPTDFSSQSRVAVNYAYQLGLKLKAELYLLHVTFIDAPPVVMVGLQVQELEKERVEVAQKAFKQLIKELQYRRRNTLKISSHVVLGYPVETTIEKFATDNNIDLIIMGTKGVSGIAKNILGSNTANVINNSEFPVISVPESAVFKPVKHIVYATDMTEIDQEVNTLIPLVKLFRATFHLLHIVPENYSEEVDPEAMEKELIKKTGYDKIRFFVSENDNINKGIDEYLAIFDVDLLVMFTHQLTFFEKLFGRSVTRQEAFHAGVPILTFRKQMHILM
jgi:nucleotide-binding universal stress UspA family protein